MLFGKNFKKNKVFYRQIKISGAIRVNTLRKIFLIVGKSSTTKIKNSIAILYQIYT
jgi:hypothetical protein